MIRTNKYPVPNFIVPQNVLVSTFDKKDLNVLVDHVLSANDRAMFYSTGGTGRKLKEIMGTRTATNYLSVEDFTGCPEMEGELVKTLHPKIYAGLLAERRNPAHEAYLSGEMAKFGRGPGVYFDIFAGNLYPFNDVLQQDGGSAEVARCYIDIGGPGMTIAAAKNWHSVTALTKPSQYEKLGQIMQQNNGSIPAASRFRFGVEAMRVVASFRMNNYGHFTALHFERDVLPTIQLVSK